MNEVGGSMAESSSLKVSVSLRCGGITLKSGSGTEGPSVENSRRISLFASKEKKRKETQNCYSVMPSSWVTLHIVQVSVLLAIGLRYP
jgi:hypothetical protein